MKVLIYNTDQELKLLTNKVIKAKKRKYRLVASREYKDSKRKGRGTYRQQHHQAWKDRIEDIDRKLNLKERIDKRRQATALTENND